MTNDNTVHMYKNITHNIIQYLEDSTNVISIDDEKQLQIYINDYFKILESYYINKLPINSDKYKLSISCMPFLPNKVSTITLQVSLKSKY